MKFRNVLKLYRSCYPSAEPYRITLSGNGSLLVSDRRFSARLNICAPAPFTNTTLTASCAGRYSGNCRATLLDAYFCDNRREFFMMGEAGSLYGIVYAENLGAILRSAGHCNASARNCCDGLKLIWLFALADSLTHNRHSLTSFTVDRAGSVLAIAACGDGQARLHITPDGQLLASGTAPGYDYNSGDDARYVRWFCRDNATWLAHFATGKEAGL